MKRVGGVGIYIEREGKGRDSSSSELREEGRGGGKGRFRRRFPDPLHCWSNSTAKNRLFLTALSETCFVCYVG